MRVSPNRKSSHGRSRWGIPSRSTRSSRRWKRPRPSSSFPRRSPVWSRPCTNSPAPSWRSASRSFPSRLRATTAVPPAVPIGRRCRCGRAGQARTEPRGLRRRPGEFRPSGPPRPQLRRPGGFGCRARSGGRAGRARSGGRAGRGTDRRPQSAERPRSTPPVRKLAKDLGVDLAAVTGTGEFGLITRDDVRNFVGGGDLPVAPRDLAGVSGQARRRRRASGKPARRSRVYGSSPPPPWSPAPSPRRTSRNS